MIYILLLEKDKWYIGYTDREDGERFAEHFTGNGSKWTQKYKPIQVIEWREGTLEDENKVTLEYMKKYGWWNVRGGSYCNVEMSAPPKQLVPELPSRINNVVSIKPKNINKTTSYKKSDACYRCGRDSHYAIDCYATTHINGDYIDDDY